MTRYRLEWHANGYFLVLAMEGEMNKKYSNMFQSKDIRVVYNNLPTLDDKTFTSTGGSDLWSISDMYTEHEVIDKLFSHLAGLWSRG